MLNYYCCFINPVEDNTEKDLDQIAPSGFKYGFPIYNSPVKIGDYTVIKPIGRGFYAATYIVEDDLLQPKVLKVIPKKVYEYFNKDFKQECILHAKIANGSEHLVGINTKFDTVVDFPNIAEIDCHVAVLDFVKGKTLDEILSDEGFIDSSKIAQIAVDMFKLLNELTNKQANHNDLHSGNLILKELDESNKRADELNNYYKLIAIDLGSLSGVSKSTEDRLGDIHRIAEYLKILSKKLLEKPTETNDNEYRLAYLLLEQASLLSAKIENQTIIGYLDVIESIKDTFRKTYLPWKEKLELKSFGDSYNAQTLQPWYVPSLLVDPEGKWSSQISTKGPLLITGMRGCGKTMLLRALQFHARAIPIDNIEENNNELLKERIKNESYIGLYVSSRKLLDKLGKPTEEPLFEPFSRLFIAYALEAVRTIRHLGDISKDFIVPLYYTNIKNVVSNVVKTNNIFDKVNSDISLENVLIDILFSLNKGELEYKIELAPSIAFNNLADAILKCSTIWHNHYILYLLDDVSTRYFHDRNISDLLSSLIFQSEACAFKITSEAQTIQVILNSPGNIEKARLGRDVESFDLGKEVYDKIRENGLKQGSNFIENILIKRATYFANHPKYKPSELLGDSSLIEIAKTICLIPSQTELKNKVYWGQTALAGICVGDIGEVINLYDSILKHYKSSIPIASEKQSECFRDLSSIRLFQLNRVNGENNLKDYAMSFAEAAHELLQNSYIYTPKKLRQYYGIYIKITSGTKDEQENQFNKLIELIDAGIFVFAGGSINPRILSSDTNPIKQFVLIYRKLYGITNLIGLQHADRFELSGERLVEYLNYPKKGKEILMRGLGNKGEPVNIVQSKKLKPKRIESIIQPELLFEAIEQKNKYFPEEICEIISKETPIAEIYDDKNVIYDKNIDLLILGLGFEERAFTTVSNILDNKITVNKALCIEYKEAGQKEKIISLLNESKIDYEVVKYSDVFNNSEFLNYSNLEIICCVSGLSKSLIFSIINKLYKKNRIIFSHTLAKEYYPLESDIESYLKDFENSDINYDLLENITSNLIKGEKGPYHISELLEANADESKKRVLIAFSSPKYERLFSIIDEREYDIIELISPIPNDANSKLARIASDIVAKKFNHVIINEFDTNCIVELIQYLYFKYYDYYVRNNYNVEIALTGSKRQTIISSILCTILKISKCWCISPTSWDTERFSKGVSDTLYFEIKTNN